MQCAVFNFSLPSVSSISFSRFLGCLWHYQAVEFPFTKSFTLGKFFLLFTPLPQCAMTGKFTFKDFPPPAPSAINSIFCLSSWNLESHFCTAPVPGSCLGSGRQLCPPAHPASCHVYPPVTEIILCFPKWIGCDRAVARSELNDCEMILSCSKELWSLLFTTTAQTKPVLLVRRVLWTRSLIRSLQICFIEADGSELIFFELFSLKIKLCICIKDMNLDGLNPLKPPSVEAALTAVQGMEMLWQESKDPCSCSYMGSCHCAIWRPVQNEAAVGPSGWQLLFTNTQYLSDVCKWQILPLCHHCGCSEPKQCWKAVPEERGSLSWQRQMCCLCRGGLLKMDCRWCDSSDAWNRG